MKENLVIYCADVGAVSQNFGWARVGPDGDQLKTGTRIRGLADRVSADLSAGFAIALGFESPLWIPMPEDGMKLGKARPGETGVGKRSRPWSAAGGLASLATGLVQAPWLLKRIRLDSERQVDATTDWSVFEEEEANLFLWEAIVTDSAKGGSHEDDARIGALAFRAALPNPQARDACTPTGPVYSLIGAALLRSGLTIDPQVLQAPCLVIRAQDALR